jgi:multiple sugar transport system substrate-binding protein
MTHWWPVVSVLVVVVLLSACSSAAAMELTILARASDLVTPAADVYNKITKDKRKDITVTVVPGDLQKFITMMAGAAGPDMVDIDLIDSPQIMSQNLLQPLTPFTSRESSRFLAGFIPDMVRLGKWRGVQYMLPFQSDNSMMFYNEARLLEAGIQARGPRTWDEFVQVAKKATRPDQDAYGMEALPKWGGSEFWFLFLPFVWANGGDIFDEDSTASRINSRYTEEAMQFWYDLKYTFQVTRPEARGDMFYAGKDAFIFAGSWEVPNIKRSNPDLQWSVAPLPTQRADQQPSSFVGGDLIGISSTTKNAVEAWGFLRFLVSERVQVGVISDLKPMPVHADFIANNPFFRAEPRYLEFAKAANIGRTPYCIPYRQLVPPISAVFGDVLMNTIPIREALAKMEHLINTKLAEAR